jgi:putative Mg2+ transporter-C (MgtC) family protein
MLLDLNSYVVAKLLLAAILGGLIGLERELAQKPAGIRTNMLISLGAALFTIVSYEMAGTVGGDHTRIAAQIIPGIGFIGAGVVIRDRGTVVGITSAATLFVVASIGMAVGSSLYVTAIFTTLLLLGTLVIVGNLERRFGLHLELMNFRVTSADGASVDEHIRGIVDDMGLQTRTWSTHRSDEGVVVEFRAEVTAPQERILMTRLGALKAKSESRPVRPVTAL